MTTFTSSLPEDLLEKLREVSEKLNIPKNKLIQKALTKYLSELERRMFVLSYKKLSKDRDAIDIVEEGMEDYAKQLMNWDEES